MIIEHKSIEIFGKKVFEKVVVSKTLKNHNPLPEEGCFFYIIEGLNHSFSEKQNIILRANDGVLMKCGNYIYQGIPDKSSQRLSFIAIHIYPDVMEKIYENSTPSFLKNNSDQYLHPNMAPIRSNLFVSNFMESILLYFEHPEIASESLMANKFKEFIEIMLNTKEAPNIKHIIANLFKTNVVAFKEIVEAHIFSPISISDIAKLTNKSLASFKREFKKVYQDSPANYIKNKRLEKGASLLIISNKQISEIAYECLFNDLAHFSNSFKKKHNLSPSEFRMSQLHK